MRSFFKSNFGHTDRRKFFFKLQVHAHDHDIMIREEKKYDNYVNLVIGYHFESIDSLH